MSWLSKTLKKAERTIRRKVLKPLLNVATAGAYGGLKYGKWGGSKPEELPQMPAFPDEPLLPEIVSEEVSTEEMRRQRRRRGRATTLLTGDLAVPSSQIGKSRLLGG